MPARTTGEPHRRARWKWVVAGAVVVAAVLLVTPIVLLGVMHGIESRPVPSFPSLADNPDPSLHGTVAYYDAATGCIRMAAASGQTSRTVWCLPKEDTATWVRLGKPAGPQLVWLPGDRLQVTMFRMKAAGAPVKQAPPLGPGWQKVIDVRTGAVTDVPQAGVPSTPLPETGPVVDPNGARVGYHDNGMTGRVTVTLTDAAGTRTLLSVHGPGEYTYQFGPVFWAPNWQWVAAADTDRILVITRTDPSTTRVLVTGSGGGAGGGTAGPTFAVSAADLLATGK